MKRILVSMLSTLLVSSLAFAVSPKQIKVVKLETGEDATTNGAKAQQYVLDYFEHDQLQLEGNDYSNFVLTGDFLVVSDKLYSYIEKGWDKVEWDEAAGNWSSAVDNLFTLDREVKSNHKYFQRVEAVGRYFGSNVKSLLKASGKTVEETVKTGVVGSGFGLWFAGTTAGLIPTSTYDMTANVVDYANSTALLATRLTGDVIAKYTFSSVFVVVGKFPVVTVFICDNGQLEDLFDGKVGRFLNWVSRQVGQGIDYVFVVAAVEQGILDGVVTAPNGSYVPGWNQPTAAVTYKDLSDLASKEYGYKKPTKKVATNDNQQQQKPLPKLEQQLLQEEKK